MKIYILVFICIAFIAPLNVSAEDAVRYYDVEIVIFENMSPESRGQENWPINVHLEKPENTLILGEPVITEALPANVLPEYSFVLLSPNDYQLNEEAAKLTNSRSHRILLHTAWRQPGLSSELAIPVYIKKEISLSPETLTENKGITTQGNDNILTEPLSVQKDMLEGVIKVILARYLHVDAELIYKVSIPESSTPVKTTETESSTEDGFQAEKVTETAIQHLVHLKQTRRRMRSNELHYIDHPVMGMLIKISPYIIEETNTEQKDTSTGNINR